MKQYINCKECLHITSEETICDTCGLQLSYDGYIIHEIGTSAPIGLTINNTYYDFCSYKCLNLFIIEELKKETK